MSTESTDRQHYHVTFAVILVSVTTYSLLQSLVSPVLPTIQHSLHTTQNTVTWVLTAYLLSASVATPILGRLGDMIGKKKVLVGVLLALAAGTLLGALATSIGVMIVARVIQGAAGAILPLSFGIVRDEFPREKVSSAIGVTAAMLAVGGGLGIVLAGPIVDALDYHYLFWLPLIFVLLSAVAAAFFVPESEVRTPGRISPLAASLLTGWLVALLVGLSEGSTWGWTDPRTLGLFLAAVLIAAWWVRVELASATPLVDMTMMRLPAVWTTNVVALLFGATMYAVIGFLPEFLQTPKTAGYGFGASITASGLFLLPMTITMFVAGVGSGRLVRQMGSKSVLVLGSAITAVPMAMFAFAHGQSWEIYLASALLGVGLGLAFSSMSGLIVESVPAAQTGVASGMNANIRTIGGSIGAAVMSSIVTGTLLSSGLPAQSGYTDGFAFLFVVALLATAAAVRIPSGRRRGSLPSLPEGVVSPDLGELADL